MEVVTTVSKYRYEYFGWRRNSLEYGFYEPKLRHCYWIRYTNNCYSLYISETLRQSYPSFNFLSAFLSKKSSKQIILEQEKEMFLVKFSFQIQQQPNIENDIYFVLVFLLSFLYNFFMKVFIKFSVRQICEILP